MVDQESSRPDSERSGGKAKPSFKDVRHYVPQDVLDVSFPAAVRGYDRHAVEAYVKRVNRVIAEIKVSASPPAAVRHALDQAEEKVEGLLRAAREAADEITTSARREADEALSRAKTDAAELMVNTSAEADRLKLEADDVLAKARAEADRLVAQAKSDANDIVSDATAQAKETSALAQSEAKKRRQQLEDELTALEEQAQKRMRSIKGDTEAVWSRRGQLLDDIRDMAGTLVELANAAASRVSAEEPLQQGTNPQQPVEHEPADQAASDEPTEPVDPAGESRRAR
jgi:DivIVA domain-containing protein